VPIRDATFHALRRSFATLLEGHGAGSAMIQRAMRHSNDEITERFYRRADIAAMKAALSNFDFQ
jgi:integrase